MDMLGLLMHLGRFTSENVWEMVSEWLETCVMHPAFACLPYHTPGFTGDHNATASESRLSPIQKQTPTRKNIRS